MGGQATIHAAQLTVLDADTPPENLIYALETLPTQGMLSLGPTFSQADIDAGLLSYQQLGSGTDRFVFWVSDGVSEIGPYEFSIIN
ncbi:MAG: hypothetical protein HC915_19510 [Anaerolineae bacterium]|nr:hypothetical protein [Anaerolineae bacterium]